MLAGVALLTTQLLAKEDQLEAAQDRLAQLLQATREARLRNVRNAVALIPP